MLAVPCRRALPPCPAAAVPCRRLAHAASGHPRPHAALGGGLGHLLHSREFLFIAGFHRGLRDFTTFFQERPKKRNISNETFGLQNAIRALQFKAPVFLMM